jgi:signal transduction histidine kinase
MSHSIKIRQWHDEFAAARPGKTNFPHLPKIWPARCYAMAAMSSLENIYKIMAESSAGGGALHETAQKFDSARHVSPVVAHELNNLITIIQSSIDRLRSKHGENPALEPQFKLISEAARRAATIIHDTMPPAPNPSVRPNPSLPQQPSA